MVFLFFPLPHKIPIMGRRALRKVDPSLNLSRHLLRLEDFPKPLDQAALFGRQAALEIEVGSGKGLFMQTASGDHPERDFIGCEVAHKYARFAAARLAVRERENAVMIHGDALQFFREWIGDGALAGVHVYFPDPWWKKRHRQRRVMNAEFAQDIQRVLQPGGLLHFWTDVQEYFDETLELLAETAKLLEGPLEVVEKPAEHDLDYRTHFERRMRLHGAPVYRSQYRRAAE